MFLVADILLGKCKNYGDNRAGHLKRPPIGFNTIQATESSIGVVGSQKGMKYQAKNYSELATNSKGDIEYGRQYAAYDKTYAIPRFKIELEREP